MEKLTKLCSRRYFDYIVVHFIQFVSVLNLRFRFQICREHMSQTTKDWTTKTIAEDDAHIHKSRNILP